MPRAPNGATSEDYEMVRRFPGVHRFCGDEHRVSFRRWSQRKWRGNSGHGSRRLGLRLLGTERWPDWEPCSVLRSNRPSRLEGFRAESGRGMPGQRRLRGVVAVRCATHHRHQQCWGGSPDLISTMSPTTRLDHRFGAAARSRLVEQRSRAAGQSRSASDAYSRARAGQLAGGPRRLPSALVRVRVSLAALAAPQRPGAIFRTSLAPAMVRAGTATTSPSLMVAPRNPVPQESRAARRGRPVSHSGPIATAHVARRSPRWQKGWHLRFYCTSSTSRLSTNRLDKAWKRETDFYTRVILTTPGCGNAHDALSRRAVRVKRPMSALTCASSRTTGQLVDLSSAQIVLGCTYLLTSSSTPLTCRIVGEVGSLPRIGALLPSEIS